MDRKIYTIAILPILLVFIHNISLAQTFNVTEGDSLYTKIHAYKTDTTLTGHFKLYNDTLYNYIIGKWEVRKGCIISYEKYINNDTNKIELTSRKNKLNIENTVYNDIGRGVLYSVLKSDSTNGAYISFNDNLTLQNACAFLNDTISEIEYFENSLVIKKYIISNRDTLIYVAEYYENGVPKNLTKKKGNYYEQINYYNNGTLSSKGNIIYTDYIEKKTGLWLYYEPDGKVRTEEHK